MIYQLKPAIRLTCPTSPTIPTQEGEVRHTNQTICLTSVSQEHPCSSVCWDWQRLFSGRDRHKDSPIARRKSQLPEYSRTINTNCIVIGKNIVYCSRSKRIIYFKDSDILSICSSVNNLVRYPSKMHSALTTARLGLNTTRDDLLVLIHPSTSIPVIHQIVDHH